MSVELYNDDDTWDLYYDNKPEPKKFERSPKVKAKRRGILRGRVGVKDGLFDLVSNK